MLTVTEQAEIVCSVLPIKIMPSMNESLYGFVMRIAASNGYPYLSWVFELEPCLKSRFSYHKVPIANALSRLIGLSNTESMFLEKSLLKYKHVALVHHSSKFRMCPECVNENGYLDYMWEVAFSSACPYHGIQLIDTCSECSSKLSWDRVHIEMCKCGADLTQARTTMADEKLLYYNTKMWAAMGRRVPNMTLPAVPAVINNILNKFNLNELCYVYQFLFRAGIDKIIKPSSKPDQVSDAVQVFEKIHLMLEGWPLGLYRHLDRFRNEDGAFKGEGLRQAFGAFN
jgi:hypothetical protein